MVKKTFCTIALEFCRSVDPKYKCSKIPPPSNSKDRHARRDTQEVQPQLPLLWTSISSVPTVSRVGCWSAPDNSPTSCVVHLLSEVLTSCVCSKIHQIFLYTPFSTSMFQIVTLSFLTFISVFCLCFSTSISQMSCVSKGHPWEIKIIPVLVLLLNYFPM